MLLVGNVFQLLFDLTFLSLAAVIIALHFTLLLTLSCDFSHIPLETVYQKNHLGRNLLDVLLSLLSLSSVQSVRPSFLCF